MNLCSGGWALLLETTDLDQGWQTWHGVFQEALKYLTSPLKTEAAWTFRSWICEISERGSIFSGYGGSLVTNREWEAQSSFINRSYHSKYSNYGKRTMMVNIQRCRPPQTPLQLNLWLLMWPNNQHSHHNTVVILVTQETLRALWLTLYFFACYRHNHVCTQDAHVSPKSCQKSSGIRYLIHWHGEIYAHQNQHRSPFAQSKKILERFLEHTSKFSLVTQKIKIHLFLLV